MASKRRWDQQSPSDHQGALDVVKTEESGSASNAAAAAAAIAAKIAAQFANGASAGAGMTHEDDFTHDIDINDVRNRYLLTKGATQEQVCHSTYLCYL
jgi:hypothetical protein